MQSAKHDSQEITKGRWQWKSNPDPWSKSEEPQWKLYSLEDNYLIEKAYYDQQKEVDLGDYIISIKHMIQKKKGVVISQRPVRRVNWDNCIQERDRSERYFETELPRTMNKIFGSLKDFLDFFSRRNPEILEFTSQFEKIEKSNDLNGLNDQIIPKLIHCLEQELLKLLQKQLKDPSLSQSKKKVLLDRKERHEELIMLFQNRFHSFEEFYWQILKAYTMTTCLYENLNCYLRNESWIEIDNLLPYAFCLCKVFFNSKFDRNWITDENLRKMGSLQQGTKPTVLYRGTAFDESALNCYLSKTVDKCFSWNSVTSTSKKEQVAKKFMYMNENIQKGKYPVLFKIEVSLSEDSERLKWIDVHPYSAKVEEDEVILAPGSVFELVEISTDQNRITTIQLKLRSDIKSLANEGLIMPGALQSKMMTEKEVKIVCLEGEELSDTLNCLAGNKLIEEVEFCLCTFDNRSLEILIEILSSLKRAEILKFISCLYKDQEKFSSLIRKEVKGCHISKIEICEVDDFYRLFTMKNGDDAYWMSLNDFKINFRNKGDIQYGKIDHKWLQGLKYLPKLASLTLDFSWCSKMADEGAYRLTYEGLENLTELTSLTLTLSGCEQIADQGIFSLASQRLRHLKKLRSLTVNLFDCKELTDRGIWNLAFEGLKHLSQLTSLSLDFRQCDKITNEGFYNLASEGLKNLTQLASLTLNFYNCVLMTDQGLHGLASEGIKYLIQLRFLALRFSLCCQITDEGINSFASEGLQYLIQLISLTLNFLPASKVTNKGVSNLVAEGLKHLTKLTSLTLHFSSCDKITDEGFKILGSQGLKHLTNLTSLTLHFSSKEITEKGVRNLTFLRLNHLVQLVSLSLNLSGCVKMTDEAVQNLAYQGLKHLTQLTSLALYFSSKKITEKGVRSLASIGLSCLGKLASLTLVLDGCKKVNNEGLSYLGSQGLKYLTQLASLTLDLSWCKKITDEGIQLLTSSGLSHLFKLTSFTLNLHGCKRITDGGVHHLASEVLKHLNQLIFIPEGKRILKLVSNSNSKNLWTQQIFEPPETKNLILRRALNNHKQLFSDKRLDSENCTPKIQASSLDFSQQSKVLPLLENETSKRKRGVLLPSDTNSTLKPQKSFDQISQSASSTLDFRLSKILGEEVKILASQKLKHPTELKSLSLDFEGPHKIRDGEVHSLAFYGLENFNQLVSLTLDFKLCQEVTNKGIESLVSEGLKHLNQLTMLSLDFSRCHQITSEGVRSLAFDGLKSLTQLRSLIIDFSYCSKITDQGVSKLESEGLRCLTQLSSLALNFSHCPQVTRFALSNIIRALYYFGFFML